MTLLCNGRLLDLNRPQVMGILNLTPDSFFDGGHYLAPEASLARAEQLLEEGAAILDLGGASTRPGASVVPADEEIRRVVPVIEAILKKFPEAVISVDTWRASVAREAVHAGAAMINDISAGSLDPEMFDTVGSLKVPYILMHMQGTPADMQQKPHYEDVVTEVLDFLIQKIAGLREIGVKDIILDPGFGFGKSLEHNYQLFRNLHVFSRVTGHPLLVGISRKSMIWKPLGIRAEEALNGTAALHMAALQQGARLLRVHDVKEAMQVIRLWELLENAS